MSGPAEADAENEEDETPLFMTKPPTKKNAALDALAAIIDDDDDVEAAPAAAAAGSGGRRRKRGIGEVQVTLALTSVAWKKMGFSVTWGASVLVSRCRDSV